MDEFERGFGDVVGLTDDDEINEALNAFCRLNGISPVESIDLHSSGYQAGLEVGQHYLTFKKEGKL